MPIDKINSVKSVNFTNNETNNKINTSKTPEETEEGKEKLEKCLTALGVLAAAGIGIAVIARSAKGREEVMEKFNNNTAEAVEEITGNTVEHVSQETPQIMEKVNNNVTEVVEEVTEDTKKTLYDQLQALRKAERESRSPDKLKAAYQQRLSENLSLEQRAVNLRKNYFDGYYKQYSFSAEEALKENFSEEQIAALSDETLKYVLEESTRYDYPLEGKVIGEMKKFTPEQLIKIQSCEDGDYLIYDALNSYGSDYNVGDTLLWEFTPMKRFAGFPEDEIRMFMRNVINDYDV